MLLLVCVPAGVPRVSLYDKLKSAVPERRGDAIRSPSPPNVSRWLRIIALSPEELQLAGQLGSVPAVVLSDIGLAGEVGGEVPGRRGILALQESVNRGIQRSIVLGAPLAVTSR